MFRLRLKWLNVSFINNIVKNKYLINSLNMKQNTFCFDILMLFYIYGACCLRVSNVNAYYTFLPDDNAS